MARLFEIRGPEWTWVLPANLKAELAAGRAIVLGDKVYKVCLECCQVVRINKPLLGSTHFCD